MGCQIGKRTLITSPMQAFDWNAVSFGNDCIINGVLRPMCCMHRFFVTPR